MSIYASAVEMEESPIEMEEGPVTMDETPDMEHVPGAPDHESEGDSKSGGNGDGGNTGGHVLFGGGEQGQMLNGDDGVNKAVYAAFSYDDVEIMFNGDIDSKSGEANQWSVRFPASQSSDGADGGSDGGTGDGTDGSSDSKSGGSDGGTDGGTPTDPANFLVDTLTSVERLEFNDVSVALDLYPDENAGAALALFYAAFNDIPDLETAGRLIHQADALNPQNEDAAIVALAQSMLDYYVPGGVDNGLLVDVLYTNVVQVPPSPEDFGVFVNLLDSGELSQAELFAIAAQSDLNIDQYEDVVMTGMAFVPDDSKMG